MSDQYAGIEDPEGWWQANPDDGGRDRLGIPYVHPVFYEMNEWQREEEKMRDALTYEWATRPQPNPSASLQGFRDAAEMRVKIDAQAHRAAYANHPLVKADDTREYMKVLLRIQEQEIGMRAQQAAEYRRYLDWVENNKRKEK